MLPEARAKLETGGATGSYAWRRIGVPAAFLLLMAALYASGLHRYLDLQSLASHRTELEAYTVQNWSVALLIFMVAYVAAVALSVPGASALTIAGGMLFGWLAAGLAVLVSATCGAVLLFLIVRTSLGDVLVKRAGPRLGRFSEHLARDGFNYLLFLRLVPVFPFWLVNIAAGVIGLPLRSFVLATVLGIVPATFTFAYVGESLDSVIDAQLAAQALCLAQRGEDACNLVLSPSSFVTGKMLAAFIALGVLALLPALLRRWRPTA